MICLLLWLIQAVMSILLPLGLALVLLPTRPHEWPNVFVCAMLLVFVWRGLRWSTIHHPFHVPETRELMTRLEQACCPHPRIEEGLSINLDGKRVRMTAVTYCAGCGMVEENYEI